jgi:hypothetical protein
VEFLERRSVAKSQLGLQEIIGEEFHDRSADVQILLNLMGLRLLVSGSRASAPPMLKRGA